MFINDMFGNRPSKKQIVENINRAGNNKLRDRNDYLDKKEHLLKLLSMPNVPVEDKAVIRDRLGQLEQASKSLDEDFSDSPVASAVTRRILSQRLDLLKQYGPELVTAAIDNVADYVGDVEEIGSSDVSAWVNQVERMLKENPPEAFSEDSNINIPTEDGITMQDIRLMAGEGKLSQKTIKQAIAVIRKQRKQQGVAEGHADQQRKVFKKNGKPVGEVGIDRESSPGAGQWYMKCYAPSKDLAGYDSYEEAVAELKHCLKQGVAEANNDAYTRDVQASQAGFDDSSRRADKRTELQQELGHETNNIQIAINGKPWKVVAGKGYADSREERAYLEGMKRWAEKKSASSGKKWTVYLTGANVTESEELEPTHGKSPEDLGGADAWYHRGCNPGKYGFERGTVAFDSYLRGYKKSDEGSAGGKQWESSANESDIEKHVMEMRHAGYDINEGHGSYYCSTKKRMVQRKGPKQKRSN